MPKQLSAAQLRQRSNAGKLGGRKGGLKGGRTVMEKYGREHFSRIGKLGGRPTWQEALDKARAQRPSVKLAVVRDPVGHEVPPRGG